MEAKKNYIRPLFYSLWFVLLLIQARFTELLPDEAYYWNYSTNLAWGYFDHPPMIAFLIKCGYWLFHNELGVRLLPAILNTATIFVLEKLIKPKDLKLFFVIISSSVFMQIGGMLAVPDAPLLFFTVTFFYLYQRFAEEDTFYYALLLGLNAGLLILSKYHGVLVIGFTVLSNIKLLKRPYFYTIVAVMLCCLFPHILWQFRNNFPSIRYQVFERAPEGFDINSTIEYLVTQPFIFGPIISVVLLILSFKFKPVNQLEKAFKFTIWGTYSFFLLMTIKGRVEPHWTLIAFVPLIYVGYHKLEVNERMKKFVYRSFPFSVGVILIARLFLVWDFLPYSSYTKDIKGEFHCWKIWSETVKSISQNKPAVFMNQYQEPSEYKFYTGETAISLNNIMSHKDQFNLWGYENQLQGKDVVMLPNYESQEYTVIESPRGKISYIMINNFRSFSNIRIKTEQSEVSVNKGDSITIKVRIETADSNMKYINFESNPDYPSYLSCAFFEGKKLVHVGSTGFRISTDMVNSDKKYSIKVIAPEESGTYQLFISVKTGWLPECINSDKIKVTVL
ncbi:MAG TPA: glycosyltransferase family 39 protein [Bacteroidia bacterium]|nr:glycosyltransferase family 39 protein [Bacteroidia bacterium]